MQDPRLKGNISASVAAITQAFERFGASMAALAPAFAALGSTLTDVTEAVAAMPDTCHVIDRRTMQCLYCGMSTFEIDQLPQVARHEIDLACLALQPSASASEEIPDLSSTPSHEGPTGSYSYTLSESVSVSPSPSEAIPASVDIPPPENHQWIGGGRAELHCAFCGVTFIEWSAMPRRQRYFLAGQCAMMRIEKERANGAPPTATPDTHPPSGKTRKIILTEDDDA